MLPLSSSKGDAKEEEKKEQNKEARDYLNYWDLDTLECFQEASKAVFLNRDLAQFLQNSGIQGNRPFPQDRLVPYQPNNEYSNDIQIPYDDSVSPSDFAYPNNSELNVIPMLRDDQIDETELTDLSQSVRNK